MSTKRDDRDDVLNLNQLTVLMRGYKIKPIDVHRLMIGLPNYLELK